MLPTLPQVALDSRAAWLARDLEQDKGWIYELSAEERVQLLDAVKSAYDPAKTLLDYVKEDFAFGGALGTITQAFAEIRDGRGIALLKGLPRTGISEAEFELLTWAIGLYFGVARPQGKASQYLSPVKNVGTNYRSPTGRGYSSNAELDFHTDGADIVGLSCYNDAKAGGESYCSSSISAMSVMASERPDLLETLFSLYPFSRQGEEAPGESPYSLSPIYGVQGDYVFCRWVRNRVEFAVSTMGATITQQQSEAIEYLDAVVRRPELMFTMRLEPGDLQLLNTYVTLHSRSEFVDYQEVDRRRTLFRLWLTPPNAPKMPDSWITQYGNIEANTVRGGIKGHAYDVKCIDFDVRQSKALGLNPPDFAVQALAAG